MLRSSTSFAIPFVVMISACGGRNQSTQATGVAPGETTVAQNTDAGPHAPQPEAGHGSESLETQCARIDACLGADGARGVSDCQDVAMLRPWRELLGASEALELQTFECEIAARDCAGVRACRPAPAQFASLCSSDTTKTEHCVGNTVVACDELTSGVLGAVDCTGTGEVCGEGPLGARCGLARCNQDTTTARCEGDTLVHCTDAGVLLRSDCRNTNDLVVLTVASDAGPPHDEYVTIAGETCGQDAMKGALNCIGTGAACNDFEQRCDGTVLETCSGGKKARRDCANETPGGMTCVSNPVPNASPSMCGASANAACSISDAETCVDGKIGYCAVSTKATVDCRALGFGGCSTRRSISIAGQERTVAYCTP